MGPSIGSAQQAPLPSAAMPTAAPAAAAGRTPAPALCCWSACDRHCSAVAHAWDTSVSARCCCAAMGTGAAVVASRRLWSSTAGTRVLMFFCWARAAARWWTGCCTPWRRRWAGSVGNTYQSGHRWWQCPTPTYDVDPEAVGSCQSLPLCSMPEVLRPCTPAVRALQTQCPLAWHTRPAAAPATALETRRLNAGRPLSASRYSLSLPSHPATRLHPMHAKRAARSS